MDDPLCQRFRICPPEGRYAPWMQDYLISSLALGVLTGHADWVTFYLFNLGNVIDRTSGVTGFPPGYGTGYWQNLCPGGDSSKPPFTWPQMFDDLMNDSDIIMSKAQHDALLADPMNGGRPFTGGEYMMTTHADMVMANYLDKKGLAPDRTIYPEFDRASANCEILFRSIGTVNARVSVVVDATAAPAIIPPLPDPVPAPAPDPTPDPQPQPTGHKMKTFADLVTAVRNAETVEDGAVTTLNSLRDKLTALSAAATAAGTGVDPAAIDSLAQEIETHTASLSAAIAEVPTV